MDPHFPPKIFLIISLLGGLWAQDGSFGQKCLRKEGFMGTYKCNEGGNMYCKNEKTCDCLSGYVYDGKTKGCNLPGLYNEKCTHKICKQPPLHCINSYCRCSEDEGYVNSRCVPRLTHGEQCNGDVCNTKLGLICQNYYCHCDILNGWIWDESRCVLGPGHDESCLYKPCRIGLNLKCESGNCVCDPPTLVPHPQKDCGPPAQFGQSCTPSPVCETGPAWNLECQGTCICKARHVQVSGLKCDKPAKLGDTCATNVGEVNPVCDPVGFMDCVNTKCVCRSNAVEYPLKICGPPAVYGETCDLPMCKGNSNLKCGRSPNTCICDRLELVPHPNGACGPKVKLHEACGPPECESGPNWFLTCSPASKTCVCADGYVERPGQRCGLPAKLREPCSNLPCDPKGEMDCNSDKICVCKKDNVEHRNEICGPPAKYNQPCGLPICQENFNLECRGGRCQCSPSSMLPNDLGGCDDKQKSKLAERCEINDDCMPGYYLECKNRKCVCQKYSEQDPRARDRCRPVQSPYRGECEEDSHCLQNHNMFCETNGNYCDCLPSYDLDDSGGTPCVFNHLNGRTYEQPCEEEPQVRRCLTSHNLTCTTGKCVCLDNHVPNMKTVQNPHFGVVTCKLGGGTQGHGDKCVSGGTVTERCDDQSELECEEKYHLCTCAPGFIPTGDKTKPCDGGKQPFGSSCDPPEVIIPPRGTDPITGLPIPGPTSPPPPKKACDTTLHLVCTKGTCGCPDSSGRYGFDENSGKCLVMPTYSCKVDEECMSGKCKVDKKGGSHTHDEKKCTGSLPGSRNGGILGPSVSLILIHLGLVVLICNSPSNSHEF